MMRSIPLAFFLTFAIINASRALLHWRGTGINPYVIPSDDSPEGYVGRTLRWMTAGLFLGLLGHAMGWDGSLGALPWAQHPVVFWIGTVLVVAALLWSTVGQIQMGGAWRIGIDHAHATTLVHDGLFAVSRNPIFLGVRIALLGIILQVPNAVVVATTLAIEVLIQFQARLEETHLRARHGDDYTAYTHRVHRWLGWP